MLKFRICCLLLFGLISSARAVDLDNYQPLSSDVKSYSIGQPIIVIVVESTTAEAAAGTGVEKSMGVSANASKNAYHDQISVGVDASNQGEGKTSRTGRMTTQLSAVITEIIPNGMLRVKGIQDMTINGEKQHIVVSGIVRASDVSKNNSILSYQIANVELEVAGNGAISQAQKQNIIYKFFNWLGVL